MKVKYCPYCKGELKRYAVGFTGNYYSCKKCHKLLIIGEVEEEDQV